MPFNCPCDGDCVLPFGNSVSVSCHFYRLGSDHKDFAPFDMCDLALENVYDILRIPVLYLNFDLLLDFYVVIVSPEDELVRPIHWSANGDILGPFVVASEEIIFFTNQPAAFCRPSTVTIAGTVSS